MVHLPATGYTWSFVALEYYALILNRIYLVLVGPTTISGAYMGGPVMALPYPESAWAPQFWLRDQQLARYHGVDVSGPTFRRRHLFNFQYRRADLIMVRYNREPKWGMGSVPYSGRLHLHFPPWKERELILLGQQDGAAIRDRLQPLAAQTPVRAHEGVRAPVFQPLRPSLEPGS